MIDRSRSVRARLNPLLEPLAAPGFIPLRNRVVMAPMSRGAAVGHLATEAMRDYYERRAKGGAGLIISEGIIIHPGGDGWNNSPHLATDEQAESWHKVTDSVHAAGGAIACQLWHAGRISHRDFTAGQPVSSTARAAAGLNRQNGKAYGIPRALSRDEMPGIYALYAQAARRALAAGFDAVELHCGHGYLPDQFLDGRINDRDDDYGGSVENRCRFVIELIQTVLQEIPATRLIVRVSPSRYMGEVYEWPDLDEMLAFLIPAMQGAGVRALDVSCANADYFATSARVCRKVRPLWRGVLLGGASLSAEQAAAEIVQGTLDLVTWGRLFISNPDLGTRIARAEAWVPYRDSMRDRLV